MNPVTIGNIIAETLIGQVDIFQWSKMVEGLLKPLLNK